MSVILPGTPWAQQPDDCVLVYDNATAHSAVADMFLDISGVHRSRLSPYSPESSAVEPVR